MTRSRREAGSDTFCAEVAVRFGAVVRVMREGHGWSQERLAARADLNRSYMGEVERADVMPSLATAAKIALALGVSLAELFGRCERERVIVTAPFGAGHAPPSIDG